jgi:subtilisin family serine protease
MAVPTGQTTSGQMADVPIRVVVKLAERAMETRAGERTADLRARAVSELRRAIPNGEFRPYFEDGSDLLAARQPPFDRYVSVEAPSRQAAAEIVRQLQAQNLVEEAYVEGGPVPPPVNAIDDPRSVGQGYLNAAPDGIDARWAWNLTDGFGIRFVDIERGWTLNHEDLTDANITLISGMNQDFQGHGTAVLGEVVAVDNMRGGVGIASRATCQVVSQWRTSTNYNTAAAILSAGQAMSTGDVLLLEAQTTYGSFDKVPVETETAVFDAIRHVVDDGIVVVEAAGNGGHDLDSFVTSANKRVLNRNHNDFRDSGAIIVGAASSTPPHTRMNFSCFGSRIDCFGWGEDVDTTGDGGSGTLTNSYTTGFSGTSSASPIVAGAAVLLQSWRRNRPHVFDPETVRSLLSANYNTPSANPASDRIGVMPNLRAIIERQIEIDRQRPFHENYLAFVYILFGIIDDGPGVVWVPGKGPIPVDPGWRAMAKSIPAAKRNLLAALAVSEIAEKVDDERMRATLNAAAVDAMHKAVDRIGRMG